MLGLLDRGSTLLLLLPMLLVLLVVLIVVWATKSGSKVAHPVSAGMPLTPMVSVVAPAGWYPQGNLQRYWDGTSWTEHTAPVA